MIQLTGKWIGDLNGTNFGRLILEIKQDGDSLAGIATLNDVEYGIYHYSIKGKARTNAEIKLIPFPNQFHVNLGEVKAIVKLENDRLSGRWYSTIGTRGVFHAEREIQADAEKVFIVYGHDELLKLKVDKLVRRLGLDPVILHEQPNHGRTIIEKFHDHSAVAFAIILLTPDDMGRSVKEAEYRARARQNVIFELGFFLAKLGRDRICVLYSGNVELPSDYAGVVYIPVEENDSWEVSLARELRSARLSVDLNRI